MERSLCHVEIALRIGEKPKRCTSSWNRGYPPCAAHLRAFSTLWKLDIPKWKMFRTEHA